MKHGVIKGMGSAGALTAALLLSATAFGALPAGNTICDTGGKTPPTSYMGVAPDVLGGNFVASDDTQVCYRLMDLGLIEDFTGDLVGGKSDPPAELDGALLGTALSTNGRCLAWEARGGATVLAFVIKGGPNFHVYDYVDSEIDNDRALISPVNKGKVPQISHYNYCFERPAFDGGQGCTPGYWRNHYDRWAVYKAYDLYNATFGLDPSDLIANSVTLGMVIDNPQTYGTDAFHAVAALLNSTGGVPNADDTKVEYPYTTLVVIQKVKDGEFGDLKAANELGCPLSGTSACSKKNSLACLP
jgi:hypothetical protein